MNLLDGLIDDCIINNDSIPITKVGHIHANGVPKVKRDSTNDITHYPIIGKTFKSETKDAMTMTVNIDVYRLMMYAMLLSMEKHGILRADLPDDWGWLKKGWEWLECARKGLNCGLVVSHLAHDKSDINALNYCIETFTDNLLRKECKSRCQCECNLKPMCLKHCGKKGCYPCSGERVDGISDGYPGIKEYLAIYDKLTPEKRNKDVFMRFLSKIGV